MIRVYTPSGTLVYKREALCPTQNIDITSLTSGVYIVRVGNAAVKLVVK
ncbi:MAG: T9SS type A sorting domain-containing protein [Bacteroidetes bacterium]|nr:T9SS type A sorting domain-containing protein [Bacteroidota bacterium]